MTSLSTSPDPASLSVASLVALTTIDACNNKQSKGCDAQPASNCLLTSTLLAGGGILTRKQVRPGLPCDSTPSPGWGPRGLGPSKNRQGPGKNNWTVHVKKSKKTKWQPCVVCSMEAGADGWVTLTLIPAVRAWPPSRCTSRPRLQSVY